MKRNIPLRSFSSIFLRDFRIKATRSKKNGKFCPISVTLSSYPSWNNYPWNWVHQLGSLSKQSVTGRWGKTPDHKSWRQQRLNKYIKQFVLAAEKCFLPEHFFPLWSLASLVGKVIKNSELKSWLFLRFTLPFGSVRFLDCLNTKKIYPLKFHLHTSKARQWGEKQRLPRQIFFKIQPSPNHKVLL